MSRAARRSALSANRDPERPSRTCRSCGSCRRRPAESSAARFCSTAAISLGLTDSELRKVRGKRIGMIFQDPMTSLNPFMRISRQLMEVTELHLGHSRAEAFEHAVKMLELVGIPDARRRAQGLSARAVRRNASARDDRDGAVVPSRARHRRRTDDGPGRHDSGADSRSHPSAQGGNGHKRDSDHARPGRRGRDDRPADRHVRGQDLRDGIDRGDLRAAGESVYPRAAAVGAGRDRRRSRRPVPDSRAAAGRRAPAARMSVRAALRSGRGPMPRDTARRWSRSRPDICHSAISPTRSTPTPAGRPVAAAVLDERAASSRFEISRSISTSAAERCGTGPPGARRSSRSSRRWTACRCRFNPAKRSASSESPDAARAHSGGRCCGSWTSRPAGSSSAGRISRRCPAAPFGPSGGACR